MTLALILKIDLDMVKMYHHAKIKFLGQCIKKILPVQTDRHPGKQYKNITLPPTRAVISRTNCTPFEEEYRICMTVTSIDKKIAHKIWLSCFSEHTRML